MGGRRATKQVSELAARIMSECTAYRLRIVNRAISKIYDDALRPYELRIAQLNTLVVVMESGGLTPNELSQKMHMDASTVSRNVERMCNSGWLKLADIDDARSHEIQITEKGMKLISEVSEAWEEAQRLAEDLLGVAISKAIARGAEKLANDDE
jgi:DNA-binding MarR family transcriptional regulator